MVFLGDIKGRIANKIAIITGAASGIGAETARLFAEEGAKLVLIDRDEKKLLQTHQGISENGGTSCMVVGDVSVVDTITKAVHEAESLYGGIDIIFNNAGIMPLGEITEYSEDTWDQVLSVNLKSMFLMCKYAIPVMLKKGKGSIINTSSVMATLTEPKHAAYTSSKAGIIGLTKSVAVEYAERGIRCNALCPGWVDTEMNMKLAEDMGGIDKLYPIIKQQQPTGRMSTTREIASVVLFLASDDSTAVTGSCLYADGGSTASI